MTQSEKPRQAAWVQAALERHESALVRYAFRLTGDLDTARDAVQETFLRLCREDHARLDGRLAPWLFAVCRSRALDVQRKDRRMKTLVESKSLAPAAAPATPIEAALHGEACDRVGAMVNELPANQQEVVILRFQAGLRYREIAQVTGLSAGNVGFLLHAAMTTLRKRMNNED